MEKRCKPFVGLVLAVGGVLAWPVAAGAACSVLQGDFDGNGTQDLRILGDSLAQRFVIADALTTYRVQIDCNDDLDYDDAGDVDTGVVSAAIETYEVRGGGRDAVVYTSGALSGAVKNLAVTFGSAPASDPNSLGVYPGALLSGSSLTVDLAGSAGPEYVTAEPNTMTDSSFVLRADLGAGNDWAQFQLPAVTLTRSSLTADVVLGTGQNAFEWGDEGDGCEMTLDASSASVAVEGGNVASLGDFLRMSPDCQVTNNSRLALSGRLLAGNDFADLVVSPGQLTATTGGETYLRVAGGAGNDHLALGYSYGVPGVMVVDGRLDVAVDGGPGEDFLLYEPLDTMRGNGRLRLQLHAGDGRDLVMGAFGLDSSTTTPRLDVAYAGGRGLDTVFPVVLDPSGNALWGPFGAVRTLGGHERDVCIAYGDAPSAFYACEAVY